jgi:hypothetical protein
MTVTSTLHISLVFLHTEYTGVKITVASAPKVGGWTTTLGEITAGACPLDTFTVRLARCETWGKYLIISASHTNPPYNPPQNKWG